MRTDTWRNGDPVTAPGAAGDVTGVAVVFYRRLDNHRFVKVRITSGPKTGTEEWADGWIIGQGPREHACLECGYRYRSTFAQAGFCPPCDYAVGTAAGSNGDGGSSRFGVRWKDEQRGQGRRGR